MSDPAPRAAELEAALGHRFTDRALLEKALTHPSAAFERDGSRGNERLEFLGDAVLDLVVARLLFERHPGWEEGELTRARAAMVNKTALADRARRLDLGAHLRLGRTEELGGGADKDRVLANGLEAVLGAVYLDGGIDPIFAWVREHFEEALRGKGEVLDRDPKTAFQEWAHAELQKTPGYRTLEDSGVEDADDRFTVAVEVAGERYGVGTGRSKRVAERAAAAAALAQVEAHSGA